MSILAGRYSGKCLLVGVLECANSILEKKKNDEQTKKEKLKDSEKAAGRARGSVGNTWRGERVRGKKRKRCTEIGSRAANVA